MDPVILQYPARPPAGMENADLALGALGRRTTWPSRAAALALFQQSPFFATWDPRVLAAYVECGLYPDAVGGVRLKMSGVQEAVVFSECYMENEVFARLGALDPRIALRWVMPGRPGLPELGASNTVQTRVWVRRANATNVRIVGGGHLVCPSIIGDICIGSNAMCRFRSRRRRLRNLHMTCASICITFSDHPAP